jgi:polyisoprenoid-binding protein YceI
VNQNRFRTISTYVLLTSTLISTAQAESREIDTGKSTITVRVYRAGVLSALGHDHEIAAPITRGGVDVAAHRVELSVRAGFLKVLDPKASDKDRTEIQSTMLGPEVLDAQRHPEITFRSTGAESSSAGSWIVRGDLTVRGETRPVVVEVREAGGHYVGTSRFKQTEFGITPVKVAGGAIRVKDEIAVEFNIQLTH